MTPQAKIVLAIARHQASLQVGEVPGPIHNSRILRYHAATQLKAQADEVPWCSSALNWCVILSALLLDPAKTSQRLGHFGFKTSEIELFLKEALDAIEGAEILGAWIDGTHSIALPGFDALAKSWLPFGRPSVGNEGDVVIFRMPAGSYHVGLVDAKVGANDQVVQVLGGNQRDAFNVLAFKKANVIAFREF